MNEFLESANLGHLSDTLSSLTLDESRSLLKEGRPALLNKLKELGVAKIPERQAFAKAIANAKREDEGTGLPILVVLYSAGVTVDAGKNLMKPAMEALAGLGLKDQIMLDNPDQPPYDVLRNWPEYISALIEKIDADPTWKSRPIAILAHSMGGSAAYGIAMRLGKRVRQLCVVARRAPTVELLDDVFQVKTGAEIAEMPGPLLLERLANGYQNQFLKMELGRDPAKWMKSTHETIDIARAQYSSPCSLTGQDDISAHLPAGTKIVSPIQVIYTTREAAVGETKEKAEQWKQLTTSACELIEVKEPDHMGAIRDQEVIDHVMLAMKPLVVQK